MKTGGVVAGSSFVSPTTKLFRRNATDRFKPSEALRIIIVVCSNNVFIHFFSLHNNLHRVYFKEFLELQPLPLPFFPLPSFPLPSLGGLLSSKFMKIFNAFKTAQIDFYNCTFLFSNCTIRHQLHTKICPASPGSAVTVYRLPSFFNELLHPAALYDQLTSFLIVHGSPLNLAKDPSATLRPQSGMICLLIQDSPPPPIPLSAVSRHSSLIYQCYPPIATTSTPPIQCYC